MAPTKPDEGRVGSNCALAGVEKKPTFADRPLSTRILLSGFIAAGLMLGLVLPGAGIWLDHRQTAGQAAAELRSATVLVEEHAAGVLRATDQLLSRMETLVGGRTLAPLWSSKEDWLMLKSLADELAYVVALLVIDEAGFTILGSGRFPSGPTDVSDREYFRVHRDGADYHIGRTILGRLAQQFVFTVSRRMEHPDGSFAGVLAVTIDAGVFSSVYEKSGLGRSVSLGIARDDGTLIVRYPMTSAMLDRSYADGPVFTEYLPERTSGLITAVSKIEGVEKVIAYRAFELFPLVAIASRTPQDVFAQWWRRSAWTAMLALVAVTVGSGFFVLLRRGWERERRFGLDLQAANLALSGTNRDLQKALAAKAILVQEIHHRVKNNLQIVSSLLTLQMGRSKDPEVRQALDASLSRIASMSLLHRVLYQSEEASEVDFGRFLAELCLNLAQAYGLGERNIALTVHADPCRLDLERAVPLGLAVGEVITNAVKHAFPDGRAGQVSVSLGRRECETIIEVRDDGVGMTPELCGTGIGRSLLSALIGQVGGRFSFEPAGGTTFRIVIPSSGWPSSGQVDDVS